MERTTFGMTFYIRRTKLDKTGKAPVFLRITMNGLRADTSIKYHISPQLWNTAKGRALENNREGKKVNRMLKAIGFNIMQVRRQLESEGVAVSAQSILSRYLGKDAPQRQLILLRLRFSGMKVFSGLRRSFFGPNTDKMIFIWMTCRSS